METTSREKPNAKFSFSSLIDRPIGSSSGKAAPTSQRKYLISGNWKANGTVESCEALIEQFNNAGPIPANVEVAIAAPFIHIPISLMSMREDIEVAAQNSNVFDQGAYTGEVPASQLKDMGVTWVVIGHSERRTGFGMAGESNELVAKKTKMAIDSGLKVMLCIGEQKGDREAGTTMYVCKSQLKPVVELLSKDDWAKVAIAYEPVWAIGTGLTATPEVAQETHCNIRQWVSENVGKDIASALRIQYGGSMKGANAEGLLAQPDIDGGLIGGASLTMDFFNVINAVPTPKFSFTSWIDRPIGSSSGGDTIGGQRKYLIGGNWKANGTIESCESLIKQFNNAGPIPANVEVAIAAPFIHIPIALMGMREDIEVAAQNSNVFDKGAYTGEVPASQLKDMGVTWVVIGHSERRAGFGMAGEDSELVAKKTKMAIDSGLKVMLCIGELKEEREAGITLDVCASQLKPVADILSKDDWAKVAIAYEPVWAIGTGLTATPEMAQETHCNIRQWVSAYVGKDIGSALRIQYGGSMKGANAEGLLSQPDIDGGLIGGASLTMDFFNVINAVPNAKSNGIISH